MTLGPLNNLHLVSNVKAEWNLAECGRGQEPNTTFYAVLSSSCLCSVV